MQALDIARENAALRNEVMLLRRELADLAETAGAELPCLAEAAPACEQLEGASIENLRRLLATAGERCLLMRHRMGAMARLLLIMPRYRASEFASLQDRFASLEDCHVIVDRRQAERRLGPPILLFRERRRGERRSGRLLTPEAVVLHVR